MISTLKNRYGFIHSYIEWQILDAAGYQQNNGAYIYIKNMWIHEKFRSTQSFKYLIDKIYKHPYSQEAGFVYWEVARDEYGKKEIEENPKECVNKRMSKIFKKEYIVNKILKGDANVIKKITSMQV